MPQRVQARMSEIKSMKEEMRQCWIVIRIYKESGHIIPLGVFEDLEIAQREILQIKDRYDSNEVIYQLVESSIYESSSVACIDLDEKCRTFKERK